MKSKYILSSKIRCGNCRSIMWGEYGTSQNGFIYSYYKCASAKKRIGCNTKSVRQEVIEKEILERVVSEIFTEKSIDLIAKSIIRFNKKDNAPMLFLKKQHKCIIKNIGNILDAIANGIYTDSVKDKILDLEQQKTDLEKQIKIEQDKLSSKKLSFDQIKYWLHNILTLISEENKSLLIETFVDEIVYFNDDYLK